VDDPYDLDRFVAAQARDWDRARAELAAGRKTSHWIWHVFPQLRDLGRSPTARRYGIGSLDEARAYRAHPTLGPRLVEATRLVCAAEGSAEAILGGIDALKLRSSMTLFRRADTEEPAFEAALARFFDDEEDPATLALLAATSR
jgi:Uncharacterized conserved protein